MYTEQEVHASLRLMWDGCWKPAPDVFIDPDMPRGPSSDPRAVDKWIARRVDVSEAYRVLPDYLRKTLLLRFGLDSTLEDAASILGCSSSTVARYEDEAILAILNDLNGVE